MKELNSSELELVEGGVNVMREIGHFVGVVVKAVMDSGDKMPPRNLVAS